MSRDSKFHEAMFKFIDHVQKEITVPTTLDENLALLAEMREFVENWRKVGV